MNLDAGPSSGVRSLSANLKYPYKRTISAPAGMGLSQKSALRNRPRGVLEKEMSTTSGPMGASGLSTAGGTGTGGQNTPSTCHRQQSAPILKGKMSKESSHVLSKQGNLVLIICRRFEDMIFFNYFYHCSCCNHVLLNTGSNVATMMDEMEYTGCNIAAKSVDLDEVDKESIHLLVFLFMQFLSCSDQVRYVFNELCLQIV